MSPNKKPSEMLKRNIFHFVSMFSFFNDISAFLVYFMPKPPL